MSDLVERLREFEHNWSDKISMAVACQDAAAELERKDAAIAELVGALKGVLKVAICPVEEFDAARAAIAKAEL